MADPLVPVPGLCTDQFALDNYISQLNLQLGLTLDTINENLGTEIELPAIPPIPVQGLPEIIIPGREGWDRDLTIRRPPPPSGFIGNRFGIRAGGKPTGTKLRIGELPGFSIGGLAGPVVPGIDPSKYVVDWLNTIYDILVTELEEEGITYEPIEVPYLDLCLPGQLESDFGGSTVGPYQTLLNDIIQLNNQKAEDVAVSAGCDMGCLPVFPSLSTTTVGCKGCWNRAFGDGTISTVFDPDTCGFSHSSAGTDPFSVSIAIENFWDCGGACMCEVTSETTANAKVTWTINDNSGWGTDARVRIRIRQRGSDDSSSELSGATDTVFVGALANGATFTQDISGAINSPGSLINGGPATYLGELSLEMFLVFDQGGSGGAVFGITASDVQLTIS